MKKRRWFSLFLSFALLLPLFSLTSADAYEDFTLDAKAGLLIEADTGEILYEKNAHQENFPASLTKVMVALLVFEAIDEGKIALTDSVTATESAFEGLSSDGSTANIVPGETMTVEQLLNCMLIVSANEACNILGETLYGSVDAFVARMNERATELGCEHTHFANATGLHNSQHYTTAWDLYLITREAMKHDKFMEICNSKSYTVPATNMTDKPRELHSTNFLISNWRARGYVYRDAQGIKTGSTPEAGYCLISSALRGSRHMISVVLGAERVTLEDGVTIQTRSFSETSRMFDWGFDNFVLRDILSSSDLVQEVPVALSSEASYVSTHAAEDISCLLPDNVEPNMLERTVTLTNDTVDAPVSAGDVLGKLTLSYNGKVYAETDLLALNDVSASWFLTAQRRVSDFFAKPLVRILLIAVVLLIAALVVYVTMFSRRRRYGHRRRGAAHSGYRGGEEDSKPSKKGRKKRPFFDKRLAEFRVRRRENNLIRFLPRHARGRKHFTRSKRRIVRLKRTTEAQNAADFSRRSVFAASSKSLVECDHVVPLRELHEADGVDVGGDVGAAAGVEQRDIVVSDLL